MKPVKMWAVVRNGVVRHLLWTCPTVSYPGERIVRVLVTEVRKKKRGKRNGKA